MKFSELIQNQRGHGLREENVLVMRQAQPDSNAVVWKH